MKMIKAAEALKTMKRIQDEAFENIVRNIGYGRRFMRLGLKLFGRGPRTEIAHDWLMVNGFARLALDNMPVEGDVQSSYISALAMIRVYLELARYERDFAQAWSYVNLATTLLPRVVDKEDLPAVTFRLQYRRKQEEQKEQKEPKKEPPNTEPQPEVQLDKYALFCQQLGEAQKWNSKNRIVSLRQSLWRFIGFCLLISLVIAITVAEIAFFFPELFKIPGPFRYVAVSLLGFFGGGLSAFLKARKEAINFSNCGLIKTHTVLRMLLGAAGSFVVYVLAQWLPLGEFAKAIDTNFSVFLSIGIAAGFSERLFINALEKVSSNLKLTGDDDS